MKKFLVFLFTGFLLLGISTKDVVAKEVSSYELFWPIVAGKTKGDLLYFVKTLKENVKGWVVLSAPRKAEYAVLLATKRLVEAEKLINEGKTALADKTLGDGERLLDKAIVLVDQAKTAKISFPNQAAEISNRLNNMKIFLPWLMDKAEKNQDSLAKVLQKVMLLGNRF